MTEKTGVENLEGQENLVEREDVAGLEETPEAAEGETEELEELPEKKSKKEKEQERLRELRTKARLWAAKLFLEDETYAGTVVALAAGALPPHYLERVLSRLGQNVQDGVGMAGLYLLGRPKGAVMKGSWPGGGGWLFINRIMEMAALSDQAELVLHLARINVGSPLFLAATAAAVVDKWGFTEETAKVLRNIAEKATPLVRAMGGLPNILGPLPKSS